MKSDQKKEERWLRAKKKHVHSDLQNSKGTGKKGECPQFHKTWLEKLGGGKEYPDCPLKNA